jgi:lysine 2,3-aminomutase
MEKDIVESIGESLVQHGQNNDRIYLMKLNGAHVKDTLAKLNQLRDKEDYTKIFAKIPANAAPAFIAEGYRTEAYIPAYFNDGDDCLFISRFFSDERAHPPVEMLSNFAELMKKPVKDPDAPQLPEGYTLRKCGPEDPEALALLFKLVFSSYPFPIHDPGYITQTMDENIVYFGIWDGDKLIAASSAETDPGDRSVEMTDFAVNPEYRGKSLAIILLREMEKAMREENYRTFYTIARLASGGMNLTFKTLGYKYTGTLINNTDICGQQESMNIWYKKA